MGTIRFKTRENIVKMTTLVGALAAPLLIFAMALPSHADSTCKDGTTTATTGRGACSGHGGVQKAGKSAAAAAPASTETASPAAAPAAASKAAPAGKAAATTGNTDPTGATAKCKDGTYSKSKQHKGSCSHHGGVAEFLTK
jgi:Protein of unknown function (DUF3761)